MMSSTKHTFAWKKVSHVLSKGDIIGFMVRYLNIDV